jgi:CPA2 family monovalent cation:H+ antiporter-2
MAIDFREVGREPLLLAACVVGLIVVKAVVLTLLGRLYRLSWHSAIETGLLLGPGGEFAFVGLGMAAGLHLIEARLSGFILAAIAITMALIPLLAAVARRITVVLQKDIPDDPALHALPPGEAHAIIVGYGRVGQVVSGLFNELKVPFIATDLDPQVVSRARRNGEEVYFGNAADPDFLRACDLAEATGIVITINARAGIDAIVEEVRSQRPDILIVSRAKDAVHASHLYSVGASDAVPETIEASLQLSEAALVGLGVPMGRAIAAIHEQRDVFRNALQKAAQAAGRSESYAIRRKHRPIS